MSEDVLEELHKLRSLVSSVIIKIQSHYTMASDQLAFAHIQRPNGEMVVDSSEAQKIWEESFQHNPDDPIIAHHLAIIHHARAYDLEQQGKEEAFNEWKLALKYWSKVISSDEFWRELSKKGKSIEGGRFNEKELESFRYSAPSYLLSVHRDLVLSYANSSPERARKHLEIILNSNFDEKIKEDIRRDIYIRLTAGIQDHMEVKDYEKAENLIKQYLKVDPNYELAIEFAIEMYHEWNNLLWTKYRASEDDSILKRIERNIDTSRHYIETLVSSGSKQILALLSDQLADHFVLSAIIKFKIRNDYQGALSDADQAIKHNPNRFDAYLLRIHCFVGMRDIYRAKQAIELAKTHARDHDDQVELSRLELLLNVGRLVSERW